MAPGSGKRQIVWSQGQILPPEAALAVQMVDAEKAATHFPIVISHDCDLAEYLQLPILKLSLSQSARIRQ